MVPSFGKYLGIGGVLNWVHNMVDEYHNMIPELPLILHLYEGVIKSLPFGH